MITIAYDRQTGIVTSTSVGVLTVDDIKRANIDIRRALQTARNDHGRALYLVDARQSVVQSREVMDEVEKGGSFLTHPNDRMAVVINTALTGMQTRRVFNSANEAVFNVMEEAIDWLGRA